MSPLDLFGWVSSGLIIISLMQARVLRFRVLNLTGAALATVVNALLGVWPFAAMNLVISVIDVYWILRLSRERHDEGVYEVVEVDIADAYLQHVLRVHAEDVAATHPGLELTELTGSSGPGEPGARTGSASARAASGDEPAAAAGGAPPDRSAFLVVRGDETAGMVVVRDAGQGVGAVELDYVTERFRDFTPGEFVYRRSGIFADRGFTRLTVADVPGSRAYFSRVGFHRVQGHWERAVEPAAA